MIVTFDGAGGQLAVLEGGGPHRVSGGVGGAGPAGGLGPHGLVGGHRAGEAGAKGAAVRTTLNCVHRVSIYLTLPVVMT